MWAKKGFILHRVTVTKPGPVTHLLTLAKKFFEKHQKIPALLLEGEDPMSSNIMPVMESREERWLLIN